MENNFLNKLRTDKGTRAIAITVVALLLLLGAIIVTTVIANRKMNMTPTPPVDDTPAGVTDPDEEPDDSKEPDNEQKPDDSDQSTNATQKKFLLPVSGVMTKKHDAELQVFSETMKDYRVHLGIDIGTVDGATVSAMADGTVAQIFEDVRFGQCIAIDHGDEIYTIYKNLSKTLPENIKVGVAVKGGEAIGTIGNTAMIEVSETPHLHLEMTANGLQVDPMDYMDERSVATLLENDNRFEDQS